MPTASSHESSAPASSATGTSAGSSTSANEHLTRTYHGDPPGQRCRAAEGAVDQLPAESLTYTPPLLRVPEDELQGRELIGRRISVMWDDGYWYEAVVVCYYSKRNRHRIVYSLDASMELVELNTCRWKLFPKQKPSPRQPSLIGATVEFLHPEVDRIMHAIVFKTDKTGQLISVAYTTERKTDSLHGGGWTVVKESPCIIDRSTYS